MADIADPSSKFGASTRINFRNNTVTKREMCMVVTGFVAVVVCLIFVGLYGVGGNGGSTTNGGGPSSPTASPITSQICKTQQCLYSAAIIGVKMNMTVNPCQDFHTYACGKWPERNPIEPEFNSNNALTKLFNENKVKLRNLLETPVASDRPSDVKLKGLFMSCLDDYGKEVKGGNPFISTILKPVAQGGVGGWYVFGNQGSMDIQAVLQKIHVDFWTDALFGFYVGLDWNDRSKRVIVIYTSGLGMWNYWYVATYPRAVKVREDYKSFMRTVAKLLVRDSGFDINDDVRDERIETFVDDVITFETDLANISRSSSFDRNRYDDEERVSLTTLNTQTSNAIDWLSFFGYMFNTAGITANTKVVITQKQYILGMSNYLNNMGENKTRILNNYFVWRLAVNYVQDLSWEYVHANRQFYVDRTGRAQFLGTWRYCFKYVSRKMDIALSHLYIKDHFADDNKKKVEEIAGYIRQSLITHMSDFKWMDDKTIQYAKSKVKAIVDKLGYPDFIMDPDKVDDIYASLQINATDYFQNVLNLNIFDKVDWNNQLKNGVDRTQWRGNTYGTFAQFYYPWNELLVPAGILQWPIYDYHIPHYLNFGAMGSVIAHMYVHSIDFTGSYYQTNGTIMRSDEGKYIRWWTNSTTYKFNDAKKCFVDYYTNKTLGPFNINGRKMTVPVRAPNYAAEGALEVGGLKQAYYGYKKWESDSKGEPMAPGLGLNNDQMFFVAYAQTWCYVRNDITAYNYAMRGRLPEDMKVNTAVAQMKEFSKAFNCPANAPMNPAKKCSIW